MWTAPDRVSQAWDLLASWRQLPDDAIPGGLDRQPERLRLAFAQQAESALAGAPGNGPVRTVLGKNLLVMWAFTVRRSRTPSANPTIKETAGCTV